MDRLTRGHRRFAVLVFATLACLCPGTVGAAAPPADKLQRLLNATAAQMQLSYRQHPDERARREEQLVAAVEAWRAAPRSEANNERLAAWLREAIFSSMPGSREPLPAIPSFAAVVKVEPQVVEPQPVEPQREVHAAPVEPTVVDKAVEKTIEKPAPTEAVAKQQDDPFRDDPVTDDK